MENVHRHIYQSMHNEPIRTQQIYKYYTLKVQFDISSRIAKSQ